ncbi:lysis system i-spanin subunit Rz [Xenorhabdus nematophila]|uniref:lysis system i-spanin subunit Rz n=1 Tax=Xenorhabdus nematophila TaxID=628 RepID=UPI00054330EA|nr:hypothetical protein XNW1_4910012 [Xenorhabdus nematophila str. Websteri]
MASGFLASPQDVIPLTARLTDVAIRNYWLLGERIATAEQMILGLQEYVRAECLR